MLNWQMSLLLAATIILVGGVLAFFIGRETGNGALPLPVSGRKADQFATTPTTFSGGSSITSTTIVATFAPTVSYEQIAFPEDAQILLTDTVENGFRSRIIKAVATSKEQHSIEPAQDSDKPSKRTIVSTSASSIDIVRKVVADLEGKGWQQTSRFLNGSKFNYIYKKVDHYLWLNGDVYLSSDWNDVLHFLTYHDVPLLNAISATGKVKSEVIEFVEGFKVPDKDIIVQVVTGMFD